MKLLPTLLRLAAAALLLPAPACHGRSDGGPLTSTAAAPSAPPPAAPAPPPVRTESFAAPVLGAVTAYRPGAAEPGKVVLFFSGDGGWNAGVVSMARYLAGQQDALVVGISTPAYFRHMLGQQRRCVYPAAEVEAFSAWVQRRYGLRRYHKPLLVGYSSGATLVYGLLAQAPTGTFRGGISLGFCPDLELNKPLCAGSGLKQHVYKPGHSYWLEPVPYLDNPWCLIQGELDQVCTATDAAAFVQHMQNAFLERLPKVGHGFGNPARWQPALRQALARLDPQPAPPASAASAATASAAPAPPAASDTGLPLHLTPAPAGTATDQPLALLISGDGGWTGFDQGLATALARRGLPVVGLDAQQYFWQARTPAETAAALAPVLRRYQQQWQRPRVVLVGYSFGANVLAFVLRRLPPELRAAVAATVLVSPTPRADFEIHLADMLGVADTRDTYDVLDELRRRGPGAPVRCLFGSDEDASLPTRFQAVGAAVQVLPGSHHFNDDYDALAAAVWPR